MTQIASPVGTENTQGPRAPDTEQVAPKGGGRVQAAQTKSQQKYKQIANNDEAWDNFAFALTGKTAAERSPEQNRKLNQLRKEMQEGSIAPEFIEADPANSSGPNRLPRGARGAFVDDGAGGRVLIAPHLRGQQLQQTSDEEQGEAIAARASDLGLDLADGDAGARARRAANGETVSLDAHAALFRDSASDTVMVISEGEVVFAEADAGPTPPSILTPETQLAFLKSFDSDGDGYLDQSELQAALEAAGASGDNIRPEQLNYLLTNYGQNVGGTFRIPLTAEKTTEESGNVGAKEMLEHGAVRLSDDGMTLQADLTRIPTSVWAFSIIKFTAQQRSATDGRPVTVQEVQQTGITAAELDDATDLFFGDWMPLREDSRDLLARRFGSVRGGTVTLDKAELTHMFDRGAITLSTGEQDDFIPISVNTDATPNLSNGAEASRYLMNFAGDDGVLSEAEMTNALEDLPGDPPLSQEQIHTLMMFYGSQSDGSYWVSNHGTREYTGVLDADAIELAVQEGVLGVNAETGSVQVDFGQISSNRATTAAFQYIADQRGVPIEEVQSISGAELDDATDHVFGDWMPLRGDSRAQIATAFGSPDPQTGAPMLSRDQLKDVFDSGAIRIHGDTEKGFVPITVDTTKGPSDAPSGYVPASSPNMPPLPYSGEDLSEVQDESSRIFMKNLKAAADAGDPDAKALLDLYKAYSLGARDPDFKGKVDLDKVHKDIQAYQKKDGIRAIQTASLGEATMKIFGKTPKQMAAETQAAFLQNLETPQFKALSRDERMAYVNDSLTMIGALDSTAGRQAADAYMSHYADEVQTGAYLQTASPEAIDLAVSDMLTIGITGARTGLTPIDKIFGSVAALTDPQKKEAAKLLAQAVGTLAKGNKPLTLENMNAAINAIPASTEARNGVLGFVTGAHEAGVLGTLGAALSVTAFALDMTGKGADTSNAWGRANAAADFMSIIGEAGSIYNTGKALRNFGMSRQSMQDTAAIANVTEEMRGRPGSATVEQAIEMTVQGDRDGAEALIARDPSVASQLSQDEIDAALDAVERAALAEDGGASVVAAFSENVASEDTVFYTAESEIFYTASSGSILSDETAEALGSPVVTDGAGLVRAQSAPAALGGEPAPVDPLVPEIQPNPIPAPPPEMPEPIPDAPTTQETIAAGAVVEAEGAEVAASSASWLTYGLQGLGLVGSSANFIYGAELIHTGQQLQRNGDPEGAVFAEIWGSSLIVGGAAGLAATGGSMAAGLLGFEGAAAVFGPVGWVVGGLAAVVGGVMALGFYLHEQQRHKEDKHEKKAFLEGQNATGKNYLNP